VHDVSVSDYRRFHGTWHWQLLVLQLACGEELLGVDHEGNGKVLQMLTFGGERFG
jgi:hypothetical protein